MGSTLEHGIYLPSEGEKNCYQGLAGNWNKVDGALGDIAELKQSIESKFTKEIVTELPTEDINPFCIYMILKTDPETDNIYDEWVYINNAWEYLGNTQVDMTQYYTKQEVNELPAVASGVTSTKVGNYDTHLADSNIHVTASDKSKWNTVALIKQLRLVNTQVGSATTIAFANIDDTNGIKVGDKCMDLDGKMFEITAVDTTNQTVTVGTALIDLALDGNVMHLSGNESASGDKNFQGLLTTIPNASLWPNISNTTDDITFLGRSVIHIEYKSSGQLTDLSGGAWGVAELGAGCFFFRINNGTDIRFKNVATGDVNRIPVVSGANRFINDLTPDQDNTYNLGSSSLRWKTINGLEPSSLSLPDLDNGVDISGFLTNLNKSLNTYTPPANGWIEIEMGRSALSKISMRCRQTDGLIYSTETSEFASWGISFPVIGGKGVSIYLYADTLNKAKFFPCLGNV